MSISSADISNPYQIHAMATLLNCGFHYVLNNDQHAIYAVIKYTFPWGRDKFLNCILGGECGVQSDS
jgi:hypothetical protein